MTTTETFAWNVACKIAEMVSDGDAGEDVKPEDITVTVKADAHGIIEPTIEYTQYGYTWQATWHDGESITDLKWQEV